MNLLTAKQLADAWQMPLARIYELARTGVLPVIKIGERQIRFDEAALRDWIARGGLTAKGGKNNGLQK